MCIRDSSDIYATNPIADEYRNDPVAVAECWAGSVTRAEYMQHLEKAGFASVEILEESAPYAKGNAEVCSFTIAGKKPAGTCGCGNYNNFMKMKKVVILITLGFALLLTNCNNTPTSAGNTSGTITAVSYTHLDVYKRQE